MNITKCLGSLLSSFLSSFLSALFLAFILPSAAGADIISIRSDTWCPYACDSTTRPGYMVEAVKLILSRHGHAIDFKTSNWVEAIKDTRANKVNALIGCSHSDAPDFIFPTTPLGAMKNHYYVKKGSKWSYQGRESLKGKRIGVIEGYTYGDAVDNLVKTRHSSLVIFSEPNPLDQILTSLDEGELDAFVESPTVLRYTLGQKKIAIENYRAVSPNLANDPDLFISFSPNNPKSSMYADIISKGIQDLRQSGELDKILNRYNLIDWINNQVLSSIAHQSKPLPAPLRAPEVTEKISSIK